MAAVKIKIDNYIARQSVLKRDLIYLGFIFLIILVEIMAAGFGGWIVWNYYKG